MQLTWKRSALADLAEIAEYVAADSAPAARRIVGAIRREVGLLRKNRQLGRPGRIEGTRELVIRRYPYVVMYESRAGELVILAIIHSSRLWPAEAP